MGPRIKMKKCITCGVEKKLDEFYFIKNRNSYKGKCKDCEREYQKVYHKIESTKNNILVKIEEINQINNEKEMSEL